MKTNWSIGEEIPILTKTAFAPVEKDARNPIHTDEYARAHGLRGALIPGSILLSYVLEMLYRTFAGNWLTSGRIRVSFIGGGAINGDRLTAHGRVKAWEEEGQGRRVFLDLWLENQEGVKILVGEASCLIS
jgi:acyl dehydratase